VGGVPARLIKYRGRGDMVPDTVSSESYSAR
jgi:hypothetical protein